MVSIAASQHGCAGSSPRMTKETVRIRMECAVERGGSASSSATEQLLKIYITCIYLGSGIVKAPIFIDEKDVPEAGAVFCGKGGEGTPLGRRCARGSAANELLPPSSS